jgi:hypothetical protein
MLSLKIKTIIKLIWLIAAIAVFIHHVYLLILVKYYGYDFVMLHASFMRNGMATMILTFPIIYIATPIIAVIHLGGAVDEVIILVFGYIQWFVIIPRILKTPEEKYKRETAKSVKKLIITDVAVVIIKIILTFISFILMMKFADFYFTGFIPIIKNIILSAVPPLLILSYYIYEVKFYRFGSSCFEKTITIFIALLNIALVYFICQRLETIIMDYCLSLLIGEHLQ